MTTRFIVHVRDNQLPILGRYITVTEEAANDILNGDKDKGISFAKSLLATYKKIEGSDTEFIRIFNEHKFYLNFGEKDNAMEEIYKDFMLHGDYEPYTTKLIESIVKEGDIAVDVGASIGYFTLLLARQVGSIGKVYSIEPTTNQFPYLLKNIALNNYQHRVDARNVAAWDSYVDNFIQRDVVNNEKMDEFLNHPTRIQTNAGSFGMKGVILDDILPEKVDFIKIDTDGSEPHVLKGLIKTIESNPQLKMVIEYYPEYIEKLGGNPLDVTDILHTYFEIEEIKGDYGGKYWNYYCVRK